MSHSAAVIFVSRVGGPGKDQRAVWNRFPVPFDPAQSLAGLKQVCREKAGVASGDGVVLTPSLEDKIVQTFEKANDKAAVGSFLPEPTDLYLISRPAKSVQVGGPQRLYKPITNYSFYDDDAFVRVILNVPGVAKERVLCDLGERSLEVRIEGVRGENLMFKVTKTHDKYVAGDVTFLVKPEKVVLKLRKKDPKTNVFSLYKQKMVGEVPSEDEKKGK